MLGKYKAVKDLTIDWLMPIVLKAGDTVLVSFHDKIRNKILVEVGTSIRAYLPLTVLEDFEFIVNDIAK